MALFTVTSADSLEYGTGSTWDEVRIEAGLGLLYQGLVVAGFCFAVQSQLLKRHPAARLSIFAFSTPIFGVLIAWAFREAAPSTWLLAAGAAVATGIALVNWKPGPPVTGTSLACNTS